MKILHIIAQKPNNTGSGVYMCGIINGFEKLGYDQGVIAGLDIEDDINIFNDNINFYPVLYNTKELDFPVLGMSDNMPYKSTRYKDLNQEMINKFKFAFKEKINLAIKELNPDLIICHHLYLLTAFTREIVDDRKVVAICHGTCLRQINTIGLEKEYIRYNIGKLDMIMALHDEQKEEISRVFNISKKKINVIGSGYNDEVFYNKKLKLDDRKIQISFAGKICESKGLKSLFKSMSKLNYPSQLININIAGTGSDLKQQQEIIKLSEECNYKVNFLGRLDQERLSDLLNKSHIFILPSFYEGLPLVVLEALACGTDVITTDISGVKDWIGNEINESGKIDYVKLPKMKDQGVPLEEELSIFEEDLRKTIDNKVNNIINGPKYRKNINMKNKTWSGVSVKIKSICK